MKKLVVFSLSLALCGSSVFAEESSAPKEETKLVSITQANVCYNGTFKGNVLLGLSQQIPCTEKPATILPVNNITKEGGRCYYQVGRWVNYSPKRGNNSRDWLVVTARCPTDEK